MKYPVLRCVVACVLAVAPLGAVAGPDYWYAGVGLGYGKVAFYSDDFSSNGAAQESIKDADLGFTGAVGVQLTKHWGFEVNFIQLGKFTYKYDVGGAVQEDRYEVSGWGFSVLPTLPLTRNFSAFGRLGVLASQTRLTVRNPIVGGVPTNAITPFQTNETSFLFGLGAQYFLNRDFGLRVEYQNLGKVGNTGCGTCTGRANAQFLSASALFAF
ncbi:MAG TPA: outer membrane beta-barrel protein [Burkholderiales bacterium]|nr:outer membrane beta-barrel protein [Burkholderiales bacterium]